MIIFAVFKTNMPRVHGYQTEFNLSEVGFVVEGSNEPILELKTKPPTDIDREIVSHVVERIKSGSTMQLGIGGRPLCIGAMLADSDVKDLSRHTEMLVDVYIGLYNKGKLTENKNVDRGKFV